MAATQSDEVPMEPADLVTAATRGVGELSAAESASATATVIAAALLLASQANRRNAAAGAEPDRPCTNEAQEVPEEVAGVELSQSVVSGEAPQGTDIEDAPQEQNILEQVHREPFFEELTQQELAAEGVYDDVAFVAGVPQEDTVQDIGVQQDIKARRSESEDEEVAEEVGEDEEVDEEEEEDDGPPRLEEPSDVYEEEEEEDPEFMERELPEEDVQSSGTRGDMELVDAEDVENEVHGPSCAEEPVTCVQDHGRPDGDDPDDEPEEFHDLPWDMGPAPCDAANEGDGENAPFEILSLWDEDEDVPDTDEVVEDIGTDVAQEPARLDAAAMEPRPVSHDRHPHPGRSSMTDVEIIDGHVQVGILPHGGSDAMPSLLADCAAQESARSDEGEGSLITDSSVTPLHALVQDPAHNADVA